MSDKQPTKRTLVIEVDVTGWTDEQIQSLDMHMSVQLAAEDGSYPDAEQCVSRIVDEYREKRPFGDKRPRVSATYLSGAPDEVVTHDPH